MSDRGGAGQGRGSFPLSFPAILTCVVGTAISLLMFFVVAHLNDARIHSEFLREAADLSHTLQVKVQRNTDQLTAMAAFFEAAKTVGRSEFRRFTRDVQEQHGDVLAFNWIPRVPDAHRAALEATARAEGIADFQVRDAGAPGELGPPAGRRAEYYPILYNWPLEGNRAAVGYDMGVDPVRWPVLEAARDTGRLAASGRLRTIREPSMENPGILLALPAYGAAEVPEGSAARRAALRGFVGAVYRMGDLVRSAMPDLAARHLAVEIRDLSAPAEESLLYGRGSAGGAGELTSTTEYPVGNRRHQVTVRAESAYVAARRHGQRWLVLAVGMATTLLLTGAVNLSVRRAQATARALQAAADSAARARQVVESTLDAVIVSDETDRILDWNPAAETLFGWPTAEAIGRNLGELIIPPVRREARRRRIAEYLDGATERPLAREAEYAFLHREGREILAEVTVSTWRSEGRPTFVSVYRDIRERKEAERALRESEARFAASFKNTPAWLVVVHLESARIVEANDSFTRLYGYTRDEAVGRTPWELGIHTEAAYRGILEEMRHRRSMRDTETVVRTRSGECRTVLVSREFIDIQGEPHILAMGLDITERVRAEAALQQLNAELEARVQARTAEVADLYNHAPCGYHSVNADGVFVHINDTELGWLGYARAEVVGRLRFHDLVTPAGVAKIQENFPILKAQGRVPDLEFDLVRKDGSIFPVLLNATAVRDASGAFVMSRSTVFDLTARRQAEAAVRKSRDALEAANAELQRAARMKDDFLANMSHELRTPLNAVLGITEALQEAVYGPLAPRQAVALQRVEASGRHLLGLINDVLDLAKVEAGKIELELGPVAVADCGQASLQLIREAAGKKRQTVTATFDPAVPALLADARRLKQVLVNLLTNAVKFTPEGGSLGLEVQGDPERQAVRFTVWDTGIGIPAAEQARLFQPFVQLDSSLARQHEGTGLGLALVARLAALHGGSVALASTPGEGSRFTVWLPWRVPAAPEGAAPVPEPATAPVGSPGIPAPAAPLLLLAEDNPVSVATLSDYLQARGYRLAVAKDGLEALALAHQERPALILMDVQMPGMDGLEATRRLRADPDPALAAVPILALTALAMRGDRERCLEAGATAYMAKPVRLKELSETVARLVRGARP